jgi:hypothetical protein
MRTELCFANSYPEARRKFYDACARAGVTPVTYENPNGRTPDGQPLACDVAQFGRSHAPKVLFAISGTHGQEGFAGSAIQIQWIFDGGYKDLPPDGGVVFLHANNPYGFAHLSRTTEHNVDLNRNFIDHSAPSAENPLYAELHRVFCPETVNEAILAQVPQQIAALIQKHGVSTFMDASSRGQYSYPDGLGFGGRGPEWSNTTLRRIVQTHLAQAKHIAFIDWHTGLGKRGEPFFLSFNPRDGDLFARAATWWGADNLNNDAAGFGDARRPNYTGLVFYGVQDTLPQADMAGAVIEFGTLPVPEIIQAVMIDRWLRFKAEPQAKETQVLRERMFETFCPRVEAWRQQVLEAAQQIYVQALRGLREW